MFSKLAQSAAATLIAVLAAGVAVGPAVAESAHPTSATVFSGGASDKVRPLLGAGVYQTSREFGYYLNGGLSIARTNPYYSDLTVGAFNDPVTDRFGTGYFLNIGASLPVGSVVTLYGGVGVAGVTGVAEQYDATKTLSADGNYYVKDPSADAVGTNYNAGILVSAGRVVLEAGYNSYFDSSYVGIGFGF
jgi:hypothetical protein